MFVDVSVDEPFYMLMPLEDLEFSTETKEHEQESVERLSYDQEEEETINESVVETETEKEISYYRRNYIELLFNDADEIQFLIEFDPSSKEKRCFSVKKLLKLDFKHHEKCVCILLLLILFKFLESNDFGVFIAV